MKLTNKPIMGMIHCNGTVEQTIKEIEIYEEEGVDAIIVENYHGSTRDVIDVLKELRKHSFTIEVGINILPNDYLEALMLARTYGGSFIQLDHVAGNYGNYGTHVDVVDFNSCRKAFPEIKVFGGVWPKYYTPVEGSNLEDDVIEGKKRADAIVVTGEGTGKETPLLKIQSFREMVGEDYPLIIGAGLDAYNVGEQLPFADGAIVGSCFKRFKRTQEPINRKLVREFMYEVKKVRE